MSESSLLNFYTSINSTQPLSRQRRKLSGELTSMASSKILLINPFLTPSPPSDLQRSNFLRSRQNHLSISTTRIIASSSSSSSSSPALFSHSKTGLFLSPGSLPETTGSTRPVIVRSQLISGPLISPHDKWGMWTALFATSAFGIWSEKTKVGKTVSGAIVSILIGLAASNLGLVSCESPAYSVVLEFLLPLAVPLLLFRADLRRIVQSTGTLLLAFLLGSVATTVGTALAFLMVPMRSLGPDGWKVAAALMGRHIGGAVNYVAISEALGMSSSVLAAGLAADNVICAFYFATLFALASKIPPESSSSTNDGTTDEGSNHEAKLPVLQFATALAVAFAICKAGAFVTKYFGIPGGSLPAITAIVVILATTFPSQFNTLAPAGEAMALILMQVFFTVVGASGNIWSVINTAPSILMFALTQISIHLAVILGLGKLFQFDRKLLLIASNANVGGPTTACGMATAKGWTSLIIPGILAGIFGISIATFLGIAFGVTSQAQSNPSPIVNGFQYDTVVYYQFHFYTPLSVAAANPVSPPAVTLPFPPKPEFTPSYLIHKTTPLSPPFETRHRIRSVVVRSQLRHPIISPDDHWGTWTGLFAAGAFGLWSEKTKIGRMVSAALVSTLVGLAAINLGLIPYEAPAHSTFLEFLLPVSVPLLLFRADLRRLVRSTGTLLLAFLLGSVATIVGTVVAFLMVPMRSLGQDSWKIAAALMGSYIGGSINYVAISEALGVSPSVLAAGVAADNVICAIYFMAIFALASKIPPEASSTDGVEMDTESDSGGNKEVLQTATAIAISFAICKVASYLTKLCRIQGGSLPGVTAIVVSLATLFPTQFGYLAPAGDKLALVLMQVGAYGMSSTQHLAFSCLL
ncbi:hypothetical protein Ddye_013826 [Dipteronia dyeriana]|uniref:DUF819 domain-containing protein n=1 Tax=Dipteronia dyeriana TaxID=168575 RepID=A0AAD9X6W9_9ROSI|nr:hypothetical protein Ddye_013826 [Dipteronia dyeriana]